MPRHKCRTLKDVPEKDGNFTFPKEPYVSILSPKTQVSGLIFSGYRKKSLRKAGVRANTEHLSMVHKQPNRIYSVHGIHPTISSQESSGKFWIMLENGAVRKLTVNECFRIMGFPDKFRKPLSDGHLYSQIGNSVCVPMIRNVAKGLLKYINHA